MSNVLRKSHIPGASLPETHQYGQSGTLFSFKGMPESTYRPGSLNLTGLMSLIFCVACLKSCLSDSQWNISNQDKIFMQPKTKSESPEEL